MTTPKESAQQPSGLDALTPAQAALGSARFEELDSLRGVAALIVFFYHCIFLLAVYPPWVDVLISSPLTLLVYGGHQAVILFFVLSGFVLYIPYSRTQNRIPYSDFVIKRICRIYLPYLFSVAFVVLVYSIFYKPIPPQGVSNLYGWQTLNSHRMVGLIRDFVLFVGFFKRDYLNGPTWTLAEEMRISLLFPFIAITVQRTRPALSILLALIGSGIVSLGITLTHHRSPLETLHYSCLFAWGAILASNLRRTCGFWQSLRTGKKLLWGGASFLVCAYSPALQAQFPMVIREEAADWLVALTVSVLLIAAITEAKFGDFLRHRFMLHCGRTSYGIYLLHLPVLFVCVNLFWSRVPHLVVYAAALTSTLIAAHFFYRFIELPSIALGKRLTLRDPDGCLKIGKFWGQLLLLRKAHGAVTEP